MGVLADFYISTDADAPAYDKAQSLPDSERVQYKSITILELSTLWAIIQGREWDVQMMDDFQCLLEQDGGERLIYRVAPALVSLLAASDADTLRRTAAAWAQTEELQWETSDAQMVLDDLVRLARRAQESGKGLYLWNCV